jgi:5-methylcytosine-specific restriction endonuclease McrA
MCRRCRQDLSKYGISIFDLVKRDGPDCRLCGLVVDLVLRAPDPGTPSIDHRIPRAAGGGNDPTNLQLAHLYCNIAKHDKLIPEPA